MTLSQSQIVLLESLKSILSNHKPNYPDNVNWDEVIVEANAHTILGLVSPALPFHVEMIDQCKAAYLRIIYEQNRLLQLFDVANVTCVILKGCAAAVYYPKPYLRAMGDIDILVPNDRFIESVNLLESNGYTCIDGKDDSGNVPEDVRELAYMKNGVEVELHHHFSSSGYNIDEFLEDAIRRREYRELLGYRFPMFPEIENGLVLLGHINQHLKNNLLGLRQVIDWEMYLNSIVDRVAWEQQFVPIAEQIGLLKLASYVTKMCMEHLGLPGPFAMCNGINDDLSDELLSVIMTDGNFGRRKDSTQPREEKVARGAAYEIKRTGFFSFFQGVGLRTWGLYKKYPVLKPFAFIYGIVRLSFRGIKAVLKKRLLFKKMDEGRSRYELYKKIGVKQEDEN